MSSIFYNIEPKVINTELACLIGLNGAIVLQQLHYWIEKNKAANTNFHDGHYWTYGTIPAYHSRDFRFWSFDTVRRTFKKLEQMGYLIMGNYNKLKMNHMKWYAINYSSFGESSGGAILYNKEPKVINTELACLIGLNEAIVLQQLHYWLGINKETNTNFRDGRYWTYGTMQEYHERDFRFLGFDTVKRTIIRLISLGFLLKGNYNKLKIDQTSWYSIDYQAVDDLIIRKKSEEQDAQKPCNSPIGQNAIIEQGKLHSSNMADCPDGTLHNPPIEHGILPYWKSADCPIPSVQTAPMEHGKMPSALPKTKKQINDQRLENETNTQKTRSSQAASPSRTASECENQSHVGEVVTASELLFDEFWKLYPRKESKQQARKAWAKLNPDQAQFSLIANALEYRSQTKEWLAEGGRYIPHPATWLNGRRWEDELTPQNFCESAILQEKYGDMQIDGKPLDPIQRKQLEYIEKRLRERNNSGEV